jgi:hypothetical protein
VTRQLLDGDGAVDDNHPRKPDPPWAMGRRAWLFAGSQLASQLAAVLMSLVQSAKLNGHDPWAYLNDVLTRLSTHLNSRIDQLLPHNWHIAGALGADHQRGFGIRRSSRMGRRDAYSQSDEYLYSARSTKNLRCK